MDLSNETGEGKTMGVCFDPNNDMFRRAIKSEIYVDKTSLLAITNQLIGTENLYMCTSRQRQHSFSS